MTNDTLFLPPNNLTDLPPLHYRNKKCNRTVRPKVDARKKKLQNIIFQGWDVISGFSRVFFQGQTKSRVFQGLPGLPEFVGNPVSDKSLGTLALFLLLT